VVIDLSKLKTVDFDSSTGEVVIGTGNKLGTVAYELNKYGRALPHGTCPDVGIGGHACAYYRFVIF
jgi:FAD/FMN-containing dehydrogenase